MSKPTVKGVAEVLPALLRRVPPRLRGWLYLALAAIAAVFIVVTAWRDGLSVEQLIALIAAAAGSIARANLNPKD